MTTQLFTTIKAGWGALALLVVVLVAIVIAGCAIVSKVQSIANARERRMDEITYAVPGCGHQGCVVCDGRVTR